MSDAWQTVQSRRRPMGQPGYTAFGGGRERRGYYSSGRGAESVPKPAKVQTFDEMFPDGLGVKVVGKADGGKPVDLATELAISKAVEERLAEARKARLSETTTIVRPDFVTYRRRLREKAEQKAYKTWLEDMTVLSENSTLFRVLLRDEPYCGLTGRADSETYQEEFEEEEDDNGEFYEEEEGNSVSDSFEDGGKKR